MNPSVQLTQEDINAIFERWNKDAEAGNWPENPDPKAQGETFWTYANDYLNAKAD